MRATPAAERAPFDPAMMVKVLVYRYATGVFSSRKIAWKRSEAVFERLAGGPTELVVAIGREGKKPLGFHADRNPRTAAMLAKLQTPDGQAAYRKRKWISEPPHGWIKHVLGFRQFSMRGLHRVQAEWKLVCMALNLRRMSAVTAQ